MKNIEVVNNLNSLNKFSEIEKEKGTMLSVSATFKVRKNIKELIDVYKVYEETLKTIDQNDAEKIAELLSVETEVNIQKINESDFIGNCAIADVMLLDFMIED